MKTVFMARFQDLGHPFFETDLLVRIDLFQFFRYLLYGFTGAFNSQFADPALLSSCDFGRMSTCTAKISD